MDGRSVVFIFMLGLLSYENLRNFSIAMDGQLEKTQLSISMAKHDNHRSTRASITMHLLSHANCIGQHSFVISEDFLNEYKIE